MAIYTAEEFASYVQSDVDTATALLLRDLVTGLIDELADFDGTYPATVKAIALTAAARAYTNPQGLTSETIGEYSYRRTGGSGVYLTAEEKSAISAAGGVEASGIFAVDTVGTSVTHADICAVNFGAIYCSCGALLSLAGPLWETEL